MADTLKYRQITGLFTARLPDGSDADEHPDTVRLSGRVTFHPEYKKPLVFPGEHIVLEPIPALLVDGQLMVEVLQGDDVVLQDLYLPVTMDERANQTWSWTMRFHGMTLGQYGETVELPDVRFVIEEGDGPLDLSTVPRTSARASSNFITRGEPGRSVIAVHGGNGELVFEWEDGDTASVPIPGAVPGPPGRDGANVLPTDEAVEQSLAASPRFSSMQADVSTLEDSVFGGEALVPVPGANIRDRDQNYKIIDTVTGDPIFQEGVEYRVELTPSVDFVGSIQMGTMWTEASMVDTLLTDHSFTAGVPLVLTYTPSAPALMYMRSISNAQKFSVAVYTAERAGGLTSLGGRVESLEDDGSYALAHRLNASISELRSLSNQVDDSLAALTQVQTSEGFSITSMAGDVQGRVVRVGLHYGASRYTPSGGEFFFDGQSRTDFSDVRFFDSSGRMLKATLGVPVNMDLLEDNNLRNVVKISPSGVLVASSSGIRISTDNGATFTLIPGTTDVTEHGSGQYGWRSMHPVYVDSADNIFAYAGGILYKLLASDGYATKRAVLDFSWQKSDGTTVYPDIQNHAMDADSSGVLFVSPYHVESHTVIYRSTDGGETFDVAWSSIGNVSHQHTHHIHADPHSNRLYVGVDDGGRTLNGAHILLTEDSGDTWTDITETGDRIRGRDYYPTYFGDGYRLGGGESYYNGGGTIYRSEDDQHFTIPVRGAGGVRSFADFGTDDLIIAGVQQASGTTENQVLTSTDQGRSWTTIYRKQNAPAGSSGMGFRDNHDAVLIAGDTEPCVILGKDDSPNVRPLRIYQGGDHHYREAFILLEEETTGPVEITARTGYMMGYPYRTLSGGQEHDGLVYRVPLDEGLGRHVRDSRGVLAKIDGPSFEWDTGEPVRHGDHGGSNLARPLTPSSGLKLDVGTSLNFGPVQQLDFADSFTVTFWFNPDRLLMDPDKYANSPESHGLFSVGDITFFHRYIRFGYSKAGVTNPTFMATGYRMMRSTMFGHGWSDDYLFIGIAVRSDGSVQVYTNGTTSSYESESMRSITPSLLSDGDFVIGSGLLPSVGYLSDIKIYDRIIGDAEMLDLYRGM